MRAVNDLEWLSPGHVEAVIDRFHRNGFSEFDASFAPKPAQFRKMVQRVQSEKAAEYVAYVKAEKQIEGKEASELYQICLTKNMFDTTSLPYLTAQGEAA